MASKSLFPTSRSKITPVLMRFDPHFIPSFFILTAPVTDLFTRKPTPAKSPW